MPLWKSIISGIGGLALVACARGPDAMSITSASIVADTLLAQIAWEPDPNLLDALDHGIPLDFVVTLTAQKNSLLGLHTEIASQMRHIQLRYYPLSRYYQLRDLDLDRTRSFPARASALAALENLRLPLTSWTSPNADRLKTDRFEIDVAMNRAALPGVLRVSSLVRPEWWLSSGAYAWTPTVD